MRLLMMLFYVILILIGVSFAALNAASVDVNFYFTSLTMPVSILMTMMLGMGLFFGFVVFIFRYWRLKVDYLRTKNQLKLTEKEIKNLRAIPLQDQH